MTTNNDMISLIEDGLGSEGTREIAERMFEAMRDDGVIEFDPVAGFQISEKHLVAFQFAEAEFAIDPRRYGQLDGDVWTKYVEASNA